MHLIAELGWKAIFWARDPKYQHYQRRKRDHGSLVTDDAGNYIWQHDSEPQDRAPKATRKKDPQYYKMPVSAAVLDYHPEKADTTAGNEPVDARRQHDNERHDLAR